MDIETFSKMRDSYSGFGFLTPEQKQWVQSQLLIIRTKPTPVPVAPTNAALVPLFRVMTHVRWDVAMMVCTILNVGILSLSFYGEPPSLTTTIFITNMIFTIIFSIESICKLLAFGPRAYFRDTWNRLDSFLALAGIMELIITATVEGDATQSARAASALRIFRVLKLSRLTRLIRSLKNLRALVHTLLVSLPSLVNIGALLFLVYFVFAVMGVKLFGEINTDDAACMTEIAGFKTFGIAMLTLFRITTGDDWACIMLDCMNTSIGGSSWAWLYFVPFYVLSAFIMLNLFVSIVLDNFTSSVSSGHDGNSSGSNGIPIDPHSETQIHRLTEEMVTGFQYLWTIYDPRGTEFIPAMHLEEFLTELLPPLGVGPEGTLHDMLQRVHSLPIRPIGGMERVHFTETLYTLARYACGTYLPSSELQQDIKYKISARIPRRVRDKWMRIGVYWAVVRAQRAWRNRLRARTRGKLSLAIGTHFQQQLMEFQQHHDVHMDDHDNVIVNGTTHSIPPNGDDGTVGDVVSSPLSPHPQQQLTIIEATTAQAVINDPSSCTALLSDANNGGSSSPFTANLSPSIANAIAIDNAAIAAIQSSLSQQHHTLPPTTGVVGVDSMV
jgi:hypothetical protein